MHRCILKLYILPHLDIGLNKVNRIVLMNKKQQKGLRIHMISICTRFNDLDKHAYDISSAVM